MSPLVLHAVFQTAIFLFSATGKIFPAFTDERMSAFVCMQTNAFFMENNNV